MALVGTGATRYNVAEVLDYSAPPELPQPGDVIDDKYRIISVLGRGTMGVVFEALYGKLEQRVALKMLHPRAASEPRIVERLAREAREAGQLLGPHIARVLDVSISGSGLPYVVMEMVEGRDLADELSSSKQLPIDEALDFVFQACAALREAHSLGIVHRRLEPACIFVCRAEQRATIKILDFGISRIATDADGALTTAAAPSARAYAAPEVLSGAAPVDARADIWSLGALLYEMLAGRPPHASAAAGENASASPATPSLAPFREDVPPALDAAVARALATDPARRFQDARSFADALVPFASAASVRWLRATFSLAPAPAWSRGISEAALPAADEAATTTAALAERSTPRPVARETPGPSAGKAPRSSASELFERPDPERARARAKLANIAIAITAVLLALLLWRAAP